MKAFLGILTWVLNWQAFGWEYHSGTSVSYQVRLPGLGIESQKTTLSLTVASVDSHTNSVKILRTLRDGSQSEQLISRDVLEKQKRLISAVLRNCLPQYRVTHLEVAGRDIGEACRLPDPEFSGSYVTFADVPFGVIKSEVQPHRGNPRIDEGAPSQLSKNLDIFYWINRSLDRGVEIARNPSPNSELSGNSRAQVIPEGDAQYLFSPPVKSSGGFALELTELVE